VKRTVEIAGGGIAGLTTGLAFAAEGLARACARAGQCTARFGRWDLYLGKRLRVLDALGVLPRVIAGVIPASRHEERNHDGKAFASSRIGTIFACTCRRTRPY